MQNVDLCVVWAGVNEVKTARADDTSYFLFG